MIDVVVSFLERPLVPREPMQSSMDVRREGPASAPVVAAAMYRVVGAPWHWVDRLQWSDAEWRDALDPDCTELWVASVAGTDAGYFELHVEADAVELKYFGLVPAFTGKGLGGPLLEAAIDRALQLGRGRMTVNTCTLDHPAALDTYRRHGFDLVRTETHRREVSS